MHKFDTRTLHTRQDFVRFLEALHTDCQKHPERWENTTLPDFLEAFGRYAEDIQQYYINTQQAVDADCPSWQVFADMLLGARVYE